MSKFDRYSRALLLGAGILISFATSILYAQDGVPPTDTWAFSSVGIQRLHAKFPCEPTRTDKTIYFEGALLKGSVYTCHLKNIDWKFEIIVMPHPVEPNGKTAALWVDDDAKRNILTTGANVLSNRECASKMFKACREFDLITPGGTTVRGKSVVYDKYVITMLTSGRHPNFNDGIADFFLNSLQLPKTNIPLSPTPAKSETNTDNSISRVSWAVILSNYFDVALPGEPEEKKYVLRGDGFNIPVQSWQYVDKVNNLSFSIVRHVPPQMPLEANPYLQKAMKDAVSRQGGKLLLQKWTGEEDIPGIEFVYSINKDMYNCRYMLYGDALYQVAIKGSKDLVLGPVGKHFLDSFALKRQ